MSKSFQSCQEIVKKENGQKVLSRPCCRPKAKRAEAFSAFLDLSLLMVSKDSIKSYMRNKKNT
jgi:hypothetical protein